MNAVLNIYFVYLILNLILFLTFVACGCSIKNKKDYFYYTFLPIIVYTFVLGSRYMRGNDYNHYVDVYKYGFNDNHDTPFFTFLNELLSGLGVNAYEAFYFYSAIFIICSFLYLRRYYKYSKYIIPSFLIAMLIFNEYQIRQSLGFSFVFLFLYYMFDIRFKSIKKSINLHNFLDLSLCLLLILIISGIHKANLIIVVIFVLFYIFIRRPFPLFISIPLLIFAAYVLPNVFDFSILNPVLVTVAGDDEIMLSYVYNSDRWFSAKGFDEYYTRNPIVQIVEILGHASLFYYGKKAIGLCRHRQEALTLYNIYVFGTLFMITFRKLELMNRIGGNFEHFWFFPISLVLFYNNQIIKTRLQLLFSFFLIFFVYDYVKYLFFPDISKMLFLWCR